MFRILPLLLLSLLLGSCAEPLYTNVDNDQLQQLLDQGLPIYDIRRPEEWRQTGVVQGSRLLTFVDNRGKLKPDFFERFTAEVGKDEPVVLICRTGNRTSVLSKLLTEKLGYTKVYNVRDGITRWKSKGRPVNRP